MQLNIEIPSTETLIKVGAGLGAFFVLKFAFGLYSKFKRNQKRKLYPKNVVVLHQFPANPNKPSLSVPCLKLETWLRVAQIEYKNVFSYFERSSQGQLPYVTLNDKDFHDSQFIIEHLSKVYEKPFTLQLSETDRAVARGFFKLLEESFKWAMYYHRFMFGKASDIGMPAILFRLLKPRLRKAVNIQGYGRHTAEEVYHIGKQDLQALEDYLGNKKYLFGDSISNEDVVLFCFITQLVYYDKGPLNKYLKENCAGLLSHFRNIKTQYWSEWSEPQ